MNDNQTTELATTTSSMPEPVARRGINEAQWRTLCNSLFPGANPLSVLLVWDYCAARKLDPMKKPVHIVPMRVKDAKTGEWGWRDVVMPGIYEYRITAQRTGEYLGHSEPAYGPEIEVAGVKAPEWCAMTVYRLNRASAQRVEFPVRVYFREVVAKTKEGVANDRWSRAPIQMMTKCTEAAGIREGFPEETGGEPTAEEMEGQHVIVDVTPMHQEDDAPDPMQIIPEGMRENVGKGFAALNMGGGPIKAKIAEFMGGSDGTDEEKAQKLLGALRDEFALRKTGQRRVSNNAKEGKPSAPAKAVEAPVASASEKPAVLSTAPAVSAPLPVKDAEMVAGDDIFGKNEVTF